MVNRKRLYKLNLILYLYLNILITISVLKLKRTHNYLTKDAYWNKKIHKRIYLTLKKNPQCASVITGKHSFEILKAFEKGKKKSNNCYESHDSLNHLLVAYLRQGQSHLMLQEQMPGSCPRSSRKTLRTSPKSNEEILARHRLEAINHKLGISSEVPLKYLFSFDVDNRGSSL